MAIGELRSVHLNLYVKLSVKTEVAFQCRAVQRACNCEQVNLSVDRGTNY
ncbi:hypothetical protein QUB61_35230 [Microcoleus sp. C2D2]